ncbi:protein LNK2-like isoform X1 [Vicia villosa]|uniref:protein LNK2-like isoform X1 n=1 Tax=Vicia villosa TaxID=3911 RepID=UPI00273B9F21|nr:protein LNK2-like isoform X1 [Vicia villosa]XP_058721758.1 protein LNK2-like isoform X1 [Vicia villosa]
MFDWNDEELANIIWDEGGESDDHIVPFPERSEDLRNKKEVNQEPAACKLTKRKQPETKTDFHSKPGSSSNLDNSGRLLATGYGESSWSDLSLSSAAKIDQGSLGNDPSKTQEETTHHENDAEFFQNADEGKEQGDFVDYDWANIGSFDDLDRIFSNDDPIFGHASLDNSDELWSAKDVSNDQAPASLDAPNPTDALRNRSEHFEIKEEYIHSSDQSFSLSYDKISGPAAYQSIQNSHTTDNVECAGDRSKLTGKGQQSFRQTNQLEIQKKAQIKQEGKDLQDYYGNWSSSATSARQYENQLTPSVLQSFPSSILGQRKQLQGPETLYQNIINPYAAPSVYGNLTNAYPAMPMMSQIQSGNLRHQSMLSGYETSPGSVKPLKSYAGSVNPQTMTPQEKIEKLRRRQQMQAMLAIQKQQQVLGHQVPSTSKSVAQKGPPEIQSHLSDGTDPKVEDLRTLPPIEQGDSNTISLAIDDDFVEETILYRIQDVISKLDVKTRVCIRDSLFRLSQSAKKRHYASDTSSTNNNNKEECDFFAKEESSSQNRYARMPDVETETNSIDRTVARLLFHRPVELTGNYSDKLESPISTKVQCESKAADQVDFSMRCLQEENLRCNQHFSPLGLENPRPSFVVQPLNQVKNSLSITSEDPSNPQEFEASQ